MINFRRKLARFIVQLLTFVTLPAIALGPRPAVACPFCTAVKPSLVQQREAADAAFLGECTAAPAEAERRGKHDFTVRRRFAGDLPPVGKTVASVQLDEPIKAGTLALVLAERAAEQGGALQWRAISLNELEFAYIAAAPDLRTPSAKRLKYFARYLEHADALVAEDAYAEFGHAPYDTVSSAATELNPTKLRSWIANTAIDSDRKGFYGLALGLTARGEARDANIALLKQLLTAEAKPGSDFRAGFDGLVGGYLVATGRVGIELVTTNFLTNPQAAVGDVRQAHKALRFYYEFGPPEQRPAIAAAVEKLLERPADAAAAIVDLGRWQHWSALDRIFALYDQQEFAASDIRRAIIGYLRNCPLPAAERVLENLRRRDPKAIKTAEAELDALTGK